MSDVDVCLCLINWYILKVVDFTMGAANKNCEHVIHKERLLTSEQQLFW